MFIVRTRVTGLGQPPLVRDGIVPRVEILADVPLARWGRYEAETYDLQFCAHVVTHGVLRYAGPDDAHAALVLSADVWRTDGDRRRWPWHPPLRESFIFTLPFAWKAGSSKGWFIRHVIRQQVQYYSLTGRLGDRCDYDAMWRAGLAGGADGLLRHPEIAVLRDCLLVADGADRTLRRVA